MDSISFICIFTCMRSKTKIELYFDDKNNIDNQIYFSLKTFGLNQKYLLDYTYVNKNYFKRKYRNKFNKLILELNGFYEMNFPHNIQYPIGTKKEYLEKFFDKKHPEFCTKEYARVTKWLEIACKEIDYLYQYLKKHSSTNGMNSPKNKVNIWILSQIGSPYTVEKYLKNINKNVKNLLELFDVDLNPDQRVINFQINKKFNTNREFKFTKDDFKECAIETIMNNLIHVNYNKVKFVEAYLNNHSNDFNINDFCMFLSNIRDTSHIDYITYCFEIL